MLKRAAQIVTTRLQRVNSHRKNRRAREINFHLTNSKLKNAGCSSSLLQLTHYMPCPLVLVSLWSRDWVLCSDNWTKLCKHFSSFYLRRETSNFGNAVLISGQRPKTYKKNRDAQVLPKFLDLAVSNRMPGEYSRTNHSSSSNLRLPDLWISGNMIQLN